MQFLSEDYVDSEFVYIGVSRSYGVVKITIFKEIIEGGTYGTQIARVTLCQ